VVWRRVWRAVSQPRSLVLHSYVDRLDVDVGLLVPALSSRFHLYDALHMDVASPHWQWRVLDGVYRLYNARDRGVVRSTTILCRAARNHNHYIGGTE
jgi:hypothetical protein